MKGAKVMTEKRSRISEIYDFCKEENIPMLSNYDADFWEVYRQNYNYFDRLFRNTYRTFVVFSCDNGNVEENATDWIFDVASWLKANEQRYSELWRMQELSDTDYSILDPYHVTETHTGQLSKNATDNLGARTDTKSEQVSYGAKSSSESNSYTHGAKSETDAETLNYGQDKTTTEGEINTGSQNNTNENKVSAFNESTYSPKDYQDTSLGSRQDTTETVETRASRSDSKSGTHTEASRTDSETKSKGEVAHTDSISDTNIYGAHTNTHTGSESESKSISKTGNMGIYSNSKLLGEHKDLWEAFNFYKLIFDEIAEQFLRIIY